MTAQELSEIEETAREYLLEGYHEHLPQIHDYPDDLNRAGLVVYAIAFAVARYDAKGSGLSPKSALKKHTLLADQAQAQYKAEEEIRFTLISTIN